MSIPFFSIDFKYSDWRNYLIGSFGANYQNEFEKEISKKFKTENFMVFPSSRMSFYLLFKKLFKTGD